MMFTKRGKRGVALLVAIMVLVTVLGLSVSLMYLSIADSREAVVNRELLAATALAEGATEMAHKIMLTAAANYQDIPTGGAAVIDGHSVAYAVAEIGTQRIEHDAAGVQTLIQPYSIAADASSNGFARHVEKVIDLEKTPIFQYMAFYNSDLEILPGPTMNLYGRVHSNGNIFIGCGSSGSTLTLNTEYLRAVGKVFRKRKNDGTASLGSVMVRVKGGTNYLNMENKTQLAPPSAEGFDSAFLGYDANHDGDYADPGDYKPWTLRSQERWSGTVQSAEHGTKTIVPPSVATTKMFVPAPGGTGGDYDYDAVTSEYVPVTPGAGAFDKGYFYQNAQLSIVDGVAYDASGSQITSWPDVTGDGSPDNPITSKTMYDAREGKNVTLTDVNLDILGKSGLWPANGLLYAARTDATAAQPNGIRLSSAVVLAGPLTVVSENPVYTRGNYNKGDATHPKQPAAVIADAFNILSNAWNDTKARGVLPTANETWVNAAFISGAYSTMSGDYNGGFENLPRFHEKWDGISCHIRGSFVNIWDSEDATGHWLYGGDRYTAPNRDWNYDMDFNDFSKLPPYTPCVVGTTRVVWVSR